MLKSNAVNRIIALLGALIIWAYVVTVENPPQIREIKDISVSLTNMDILAGRNLAVSSEATFVVNLTVSGKRADVAKLSAADFTATADMRGWQMGEQAVPVDVTGPETVAVIEKRPAKINVNIENLVSVSKRIKLEYSGDFPDGMEPGFIKMAPDQIEVKGAKSQIDQVDYIRVPIDVSSLRETARAFNVAAQPINKEGGLIYAPLNMSQSEVQISLMLCHVKEVALHANAYGQADPEVELAGINVPDKVKIRGSAEALNGVTFLTAEPIDVSGVDITSSIPLQIRMPSGVELASESEGISVDVTVKGLSVKEFEYGSGEIIIDGLKDGLEAHINDSGVLVRVYGTDSVITALEKSDVTPFVNAEEMERDSETASLPVQARCEKDLRKTEVIPEEVLVNVYAIYSANGSGYK
ncbi:MAG: hypothetical protein LBG71_08090 [Clostridiales Family XIII bacterium]|jgi:YbbR domain-containing protein|nr:hypothetical protein [Clostridiales Family XIII bacterium]